MSASNKVVKTILYFAVLLVVIEAVLQIAVRTGSLPFFYPYDNCYYSYNVVPYFTSPCCKADSISGYRWQNVEANAIKVCHAKLIYNQRIVSNNWGFISPADACLQKKNPKTFRWIVFGDSFTDGYYLEKNWTSSVTQMLQKQGIDSIEIHSFALNGSGLKTWYQVFNWLSQMNYQYDGIILACFGNDLDRDVFVMNHDSTFCNWGWNSSSLNKSPVILNQNNTQSLLKIVSRSKINSPHSFLTAYYLQVIYTELKFRYSIQQDTKKLFQKYIYDPTESTVNQQSINQKYGEEKINRLEKLLSKATAQNKKVILCSVPEMQGIKLHQQGKTILINEELKWFAAKYHTLFFDGYAAFDSVQKEKIENYYLPYDGHWNQKGSDLFAEKLFPSFCSFTIQNPAK